MTTTSTPTLPATMTREQFQIKYDAVKALRPGDAVIYQHNDGGSVSAVVIKLVGTTLHIRFAVPYRGCQRAVLGRTNWHLITPFAKGSKFMVLE